MKNYKPKWFKTQELIHPEIYRKWGEKSLMFMDVQILWTIDQIREYFAFLGYEGVTVNDWCFGGERKFSGLRPFNSEIGASMSQHKFGRAIDFLVKGLSATEVRKIILDNQKEEAFKYITRMEDFAGMSWVHIDNANLVIPQDEIFIFNPYK
jgi:hypothetical protein